MAMRKASFYPKLAMQNIRLHKRFYLPFMLTCIATVAMFYIMCFITFNSGMKDMPGWGILLAIMALGCIVIGLFSLIFLFYTNSFLMKRRQKELGLYNILGMGKGNIAGVLFFETVIVSLITISLGLILGILFSKLALLILFKFLNFSIPFGFEVSVKGILISLALFFAIFLLILLSNLIRIKLSSPIELLRGGNVGEKEPKTRWVLAVLGVLFLAGGYIIAIVTESPLQALLLFFVAVTLVIIGTYLLFAASSIAVLKRLRANHGYYYKTRHFIPIAGMIYRMKQNAAGLSNICILSTMVLVMVSGTVCLYLGAEDAVNMLYPREISINVQNPSGSVRENLELNVSEYLTGEGFEMKNVANYESFDLLSTRNGNDFGSPDSPYYGSNTGSVATFISQSEYESMTGEVLSLSPGEAFVSSKNKTLDSSFTIYGKEYSIVGQVDNFSAQGQDSLSINELFYFIVTEETYKEIFSSQSARVIDLYYGFDVDASSDEKLRLYEGVSDLAYSLDSDALDGGFDVLRTNSRQSNAIEFYALYGGFLFLGLFLGLVFLSATVLIIYYKQLSEGYDDRDRFVIMQKVGLSPDEIKKAIHSQILLVFFLPLGMAVIHIAAAFKMITKLLLVMRLTNVSLFALCTLGTVAVFALIYGLVSSLTAKTYYKVVSE